MVVCYNKMVGFAVVLQIEQKMERQKKFGDVERNKSRDTVKEREKKEWEKLMTWCYGWMLRCLVWHLRHRSLIKVFTNIWKLKDMIFGGKLNRPSISEQAMNSTGKPGIILSVYIFKSRHLHHVIRIYFSWIWLFQYKTLTFSCMLLPCKHLKFKEWSVLISQRSGSFSPWQEQNSRDQLRWTNCWIQF